MATFQTRPTRSGRKRYRATVRRAGIPTQSRTFARLRDARKWAADLESDIDAGRYAPADNIRMRELIDRYILTICPAKKTGDRQAQQLATWSALIGDYQVSRLQPRHVASARDSIASGRAPATVVRYLAALSHLFTIAIKDWQVIEKNPTRLITWPKEPRGRVRFLSDPERERLVEASRTVGLYPLVMLAMMTGCRRGELVGLAWSNVDLRRNRILLTETKNNERRQVPLMPQALAIVEELRTDRRRGQLSVFGLTDAQVASRWRQALKKARIKDFRFHDLRHTCASYLAQHGATTNQIAEALGHKTLSMVQRYAHLSDDSTRAAFDRMGNEVFG